MKANEAVILKANPDLRELRIRWRAARDRYMAVAGKSSPGIHSKENLHPLCPPNAKQITTEFEIADALLLEAYQELTGKPVVWITDDLELEDKLRRLYPKARSKDVVGLDGEIYTLKFTARSLRYGRADSWYAQWVHTPNRTRALANRTRKLAQKEALASRRKRVREERMELFLAGGGLRATRADKKEDQRRLTERFRSFTRSDLFGWLLVDGHRHPVRARRSWPNEPWKDYFEIEPTSTHKLLPSKEEDYRRCGSAVYSNMQDLVDDLPRLRIIPVDEEPNWDE